MTPSPSPSPSSFRFQEFLLHDYHAPAQPLVELPYGECWKVNCKLTTSLPTEPTEFNLTQVQWLDDAARNWAPTALCGIPPPENLFLINLMSPEDRWHESQIACELTDDDDHALLLPYNYDIMEWDIMLFSLPRLPWRVGKILRVNGAVDQMITPSGFAMLLNGEEVVTIQCLHCDKAATPLQLADELLKVELSTAELVCWGEGPTNGTIGLNFTVMNDGKVDLLMPLFDDVEDECETNSLSEISLQLVLTFEVQTFLNARRISTLHHRHSCPPDCPAEGSAVVYVLQCQGYDTGPRCMDPETAGACAFGAGDECRSCPENAVCPGGFRAWPAPGYWTSDATTGVIVQCPYPSKARCRGWSEGVESILCGPGYDDSSPLCGTCAPGHYSLDGRCLQCPTADDTSSTLRSEEILYLIIGVTLGMVATLAVIFTVGFQASSLPVSRLLGVRTALSFLFWMIMTWQVFLQLTRVSVAGLPPLLRTMFSLFQALETDITSLFPYECGSSSP